METLPINILEDILIKLNIKDIFNLSIVNKELNEISKNIINDNNFKLDLDIDVDSINKLILQSDKYFFKLMQKKMHLSISNINTIIINKDLYFFKKCFNYNNFKRILYNRFILGDNPIEICDRYGYEDKKLYILRNKFIFK